MMEIISQLLLTLCCLASAALLYRRKGPHHRDVKPTVKLLVMAFMFIAVAALGQLLLSSQSLDSQTLQRLLDNLAQFLAVPLFAIASLLIGRRQYWSAAAWGRVSLALVAMFELLRRAELGDAYTQALPIAIAVVLMVAGWQLRARLRDLAIWQYVSGMVLIVAGLALPQMPALENGLILPHWLASILLGLGLLRTTLACSPLLPLQKPANS